MSLFPNLNVQETKERSKEKLKLYRALKRYSEADCSPRVTAIYSFVPPTYTGQVNRTLEDGVVRKLTAKQKMAEMEEAINKITDVLQRQILIEKYCKGREVKDIAIYTRMSLSETEFYRELDSALLWFAEMYRDGSLLTFKRGDVDKILGEI